MNAINDKHVKLNNEWDQALSFESKELKRKVDPLRTVDLSGYLSVMPYIGGACYLVALAIQQKLPQLFPFAYPLGATIIFLPILWILAST